MSGKGPTKPAQQEQPGPSSDGQSDTLSQASEQRAPEPESIQVAPSSATPMPDSGAPVDGHVERNPGGSPAQEHGESMLDEWFEPKDDWQPDQQSMLDWSSIDDDADHHAEQLPSQRQRKLMKRKLKAQQRKLVKRKLTECKQKRQQRKLMERMLKRQQRKLVKLLNRKLHITEPGVHHNSPASSD